MSRQFRYRVTAIVLGGLIFGAPMLANGTANAEQVSENGRRVTFEGDSMLGLSCRSEPDVESMTVPANTTVLVVNRTGHEATLQLGSDAKGTLENDSGTEVIFRRGTTAVSLTPSCAPSTDARPVMVTASPSAAAAQPDPAPAPTGGAPVAIAAAPADTQRPARPRGVATTKSDKAAPPRTTRTVPDRPAPNRRNATGPATGSVPVPDDADAPKPTTSPLSGTPGTPSPTSAGVPTGVPTITASGAPLLDLPVPGTTDPAPPVFGDAPMNAVAAAEPVAMTAPMPERQPIGLLAVIASVCVLGVGIGAIRAIVSQRANRANMA